MAEQSYMVFITANGSWEPAEEGTNAPGAYSISLCGYIQDLRPSSRGAGRGMNRGPRIRLLRTVSVQELVMKNWECQEKKVSHWLGLGWGVKPPTSHGLAINSRCGPVCCILDHATFGCFAHQSQRTVWIWRLGFPPTSLFLKKHLSPSRVGNIFCQV